ncbi:hypothetical protein [Thermobrachium celere]|uniref:hypothetical protein n=1 Tax=Thermobrachium celere TaxID=53422 RepID=UPI0019427974|nr:hypothetical protein [Thermobrachium celere]GFR36228.1 hypothetical protein TCEA9_20400 [Thermobrachium celere]
MTFFYALNRAKEYCINKKYEEKDKFESIFNNMLIEHYVKNYISCLSSLYKTTNSTLKSIKLLNTDIKIYYPDLEENVKKMYSKLSDKSNFNKTLKVKLILKYPLLYFYLRNSYYKINKILAR